MSMTVSQAVSEVVGRLKGKLAFVFLSVATDTTNTDVVPAVRDALWYFETVPSDYPAVIDADLATIKDPKWFLDAATLETLYRIRGAFSEVDETVEKNSQKLNQFFEQLQAMIADYEGRVPRPNQAKGAMGQLQNPPNCPTQTFGGWPWPWPRYCGGFW